MTETSRIIHAVALLCVVFALASPTTNGPIRIAAIIPADPIRLFSIARVRPAIQLAIEKVGAELPLIQKRKLIVKYADSNCSIADAINQAINFYVKKEVDIYFGPCCDYAAAPVARQIRYWNIPMITPGALARDFAVKKKEMFPLTTRLGPTFNSAVNFFISLLQYYNWRKVKIIYNPNGHNEIIGQYCHIFADGVHYGLKMQQTIKNLSQEYFKFDYLYDITDNMEEHIGNKFARIASDKTGKDSSDHILIYDCTSFPDGCKEDRTDNPMCN